jgi:hypothetical protein
MQEIVGPTSDQLFTATYEYRYQTSHGDDIWSPYVLNGAPRLPNPDTDIVNKPGAGKLSAASFQEAAGYVDDLVREEGLGDFPSVSEAIRTRLVDGSLPVDAYNFSGVDCSGFVTHVLRRSLAQTGVELYQELWVPYPQIVQGYTIPGWTPNREEREETLRRARETEGLSVKTYTEIFRPHNQPARAVDVKLLVENSDQILGEDLKPGDLAIYTPSVLSKKRHVAVVLDATDRRDVTFAHSGRRDPRIEKGGVQIYTLPRKNVFDSQKEHSHVGSMSLHRLRVLAKQM